MFPVVARYYVTVIHFLNLIHVLIWTCEVHVCLEDRRVTL